MLKLCLFGKETEKNCKWILRKYLPDIALETFGEKYGKFILLHRQEPEEFWCIFDPRQEQVMTLAKKQHWRTLTCGFSSYDTLVLSSAEEEQAVISLQREIRTVSGQLLEPGDYLVQRSPTVSDHSALFCTAVLLLSGQGQKNAVFYF